MKSSKAKLTLILFALLFAVACGRHKARVQAPPPLKPPATTTTRRPEPKQKPPEAIPPGPPPQDSSATTVPHPSTAVTRPAEPDSAVAAGPLIRIGLTTEAKEVRISSSGDYYLTEKIAEASKQLVRGEIQVRVEQEKNETSNIYRVQVASFTKPDLALELEKRLSGLFEEQVTIRDNPETGLRQVRVGEFLSKEDAQSLLKTLTGSGYPDAFVVKEIREGGGGGISLALRGPDGLFRLSRAGFLFQPSSGTVFLRADGKPYRGLFEISLNMSGRITVVNQVGTEEYLLGVVPAEMSPTTYPEFEGLAALSIAARTYALRNTGRFAADGFDLSDDTRTQVYGGVEAEKSLTTDAVRQTFGLAIYYNDKLIDAQYMSTCGGRTEDASNVYDTSPVPYLKSVFCSIESGPEKNEIVLQGRHDLQESFLADDGSLANRNLELARALGIVEAGVQLLPEFLAGTAEPSEVIRWIEIAGKVARTSELGRPSPVPEIRTRAGFLQYAAEAFFGAEEIKRRMSPRDVEYYMGNLKDGSAVPETARRPLSFVIQNGMWRPYADNTVRPKEPMRRGDAISLLLRWVESARPDILRKGVFVSAGASDNDALPGPSISVKWGNRTREFRFSQNPYLFRLDLGRTIPVNDLRVIGNEKLSFHVGPQDTIDFLEVELNPTGASSDRYSPVASWEASMKRSAVAEKLRAIAGNIGEFRDLKPYRIGNSGRAVQIQIIGSRNSVVINGLRVRNALGLRDNLFTSIEREYSPDGSIASFTFHGRGWGHGVGLCQVGAYGMARAGRSYEEILKTYYQGVQIRKAY